MKHRLEYIVKLSESLASSASEVLRLYERHLEPVTSKLSKGFASIPDEIISIIFKYSACDEQQGTRHAIWLSQVSRRFRQLALGDRSLWSKQFLWYDSSENMVKTCIKRSGTNADFQIVVNATDMLPRYAIDNFLRVCAPTASRWRSFALICDWDGSRSGPNFYINDSVDDIGRQILALPRLRELSLIQRHYRATPDVLMWRSSMGYIRENSWDAPNLQVVRCVEYIPSPTFPFAFVSQFTMSLTLLPLHIYYQIGDLLVFLSAMEGLTDMELELKIHGNADSAMGANFHVDQTFRCARLSSLRLHISGLTLPSGPYCLLEPFLEALEMPFLGHLALHVTLGASVVCFYGPRLHDTGVLSALANILLPSPYTHTRLTSLDINISLSDLGKEELRTTNLPLLTIPLARIPNVTTLTISTFCRISFSWEEFLSMPSKRSLRRLRILSCDNMDAGHLQVMIRSLKNVDAWGLLDRVLIQKCSSLDEESALLAVGKERMRFMTW